MDELQERFKRDGVRKQLEPLLNKIDVSWGKYTHNRDDITKELIDAKLVVAPFLGNIPRMSYEAQAKRAISALKELDLENQVMIIPPGLKLFRQSPSKTMLKKGRLLPVRFNKKDGLDLKQAFEEEIKTVTQEKSFYGWDFEGVNYSTQEFRTLLLYDHIRAQIVQELMNEDDKDELEIKPFCDYKPSKGILLVKNMPSFNTGNIYDDFVIEGVLLEDKVNEDPSLTFDFNSSHNCYKTTYAKLKFGRDYEVVPGKLLAGSREGRETAIDHHVILAMHIAREELAKQGIKIYNPFIKANPASVEMFDKLHKNVLLDYRVGKSIKRAPLDIAHIENMLWNNVAYENLIKSKKK